MSYQVDDDPPIKSHPASKEYLENYDKIDWGDDKPSANAKAVREYLAAGGEPSPIGWYGVVVGVDPGVPYYSCEYCCDTGCVVDPTADESTFVAESDGLIDCPQCSERRALPRPVECSTCGAKDAAPCDDDIHEATGQPIER